MIIKPGLEQAKQYCKKYSIVPFSVTIDASVTPSDVMKKLKSISAHCYMLESCQDKTASGRYTFMGYDPKVEISCKQGETVIVDECATVRRQGNPMDYIKALLDDYKSPKIEFLPYFTGGLVGYFGYDYVKYSEPSLKLNAVDDDNFKDVDLMLFDKVIAFDNSEDKMILIVNVKTDDIESNYIKAEKELEMMLDIVLNAPVVEPQAPVLHSDFKPLFTGEEYSKRVEKAKQYIYDGDIFQVVLSNRLEATMSGSLFSTYEKLKQLNPSPYMFYFSSDDIELAGSSPETLVKLTGSRLFTYPLAGTRPRGKTKAEDEELEKGLLNDQKELSEHNMLVDLGRNDLGKISKFGSVNVDKYHQILKFSHVMHIGSTVSSVIKDEFSAIDAVNAVLPAGTLSGAPKIRAMEIIDELENNSRGIYGGAVGYIDFSGNLDVCIAIRLAYKKKGKVYIRSGAGIVADSNPISEHNECINKAKAVVNALKESAVISQ